MNQNEIRKGNAFTLIELVIVIAILSVLLALMVPVFPNALQNEKEIALETYESEVERALLQYYIIYGKQISQTDDASALLITDDNEGLNNWMTILNGKFDVTFRGGYTYEYENKGPFGSVTIKEN